MTEASTTAQHTPGKLHEAPQRIVGKADDETYRTINAGRGFFPQGFGITGFISPADARRLAACWNACDGINTEALEQLPGIVGATVPYHQLTAQRDELLAALRVAEESVGDLKALEIVRAAIAKAAGAAS